MLRRNLCIIKVTANVSEKWEIEIIQGKENTVGQSDLRGSWAIRAYSAYPDICLWLYVQSVA